LALLLILETLQTLKCTFFYDSTGGLHYSAHNLENEVPCFFTGIDYENPLKTFKFQSDNTANVNVYLPHKLIVTGKANKIQFTTSNSDNFMSFSFFPSWRNQSEWIGNRRPSPVKFQLQRDNNFQTPVMCDQYCEYGAYCNMSAVQCVYTTYYYQGSTVSVTNGSTPAASPQTYGSGIPLFVIIILIAAICCTCAVCCHACRGRCDKKRQKSSSTEEKSVEIPMESYPQQVQPQVAYPSPQQIQPQVGYSYPQQVQPQVPYPYVPVYPVQGYYPSQIPMNQTGFPQYYVPTYVPVPQQE